jgi:O-antigen/teichoic acid export membrane protein
LSAFLRRYRADALIMVGLWLLPLAFFWQVTLGGRTLIPADNLYQFQPWAAYREDVGVPEVPHNSLLSDLVLQNYAWKQHIRASLANGELPLWSPYTFAGMPFLAAGQHSALYPFSLLYYILPLDTAYGWFTVSQVWLAGLFMYLFMRGIGASRFGGAVAAVAFQMSAFFLASAVFPMIIASAAWLPFLLLMVEFTIQRRPLVGNPSAIPWVVLGAGGLGMTIFAGHVEFLYYALLVMGFWSACRLLTSPPGPLHGTEGGGRTQETWPLGRRLVRMVWGRTRPAAALLAMVALGMALGAVQFVPLLELAGRNFREGRTDFDTVRSYAYPIRHALIFLMPNLYGNPAQHTYFDVFSGQTQPVDWQVQGTRVTNTAWPGGKNYVEGACYVGLLTLLLAGIALLHARFERAPGVRTTMPAPYRAILGLLALVAVTFVFGTLTYAVLYYGLPGFNQLHSPFRWVFPLTLCLAALAGYGADALLAARADRASFTSRVVRRVGGGAASVGVLLLLGLALSRLFFAQLRGVVEWLYQRLAGAAYVFPDVERFYSVSFTPVLLFALFLIASGVALWSSQRSPASHTAQTWGSVWQAALVVVLALDLIVATAGFNPAADPRWLAFEPPSISWLKAQRPAEWRYIAVERFTHIMNANIGWHYGLQDVSGYDSMIPKQYVEYMRQLQDQGMLIYNRIAPIFADKLDALNSPRLDALSVRYVLSEIPLDTSAYPKLTLVYEDAGMRVYENRDARPRAAANPATTVRVRLDRASHNQLLLTVQVTADTPLARIVLSDSYFPGWRAYLRPAGTGEDAEREVPVTLHAPADGIAPNARQITLDNVGAGDYVLRVRYSPPSFQVGAFTSFMAGMIALFAMLVWAWGAFYREDAEAHGGGNARRFAKNSLAPIFLNLFNRGIDFAFAAIMLRILGPASAGTYYYAVVIFGWFDTLTNFGLNLLLTRDVARDRSAAGRYLLNSSLLRLGLAGVGVPVLIGFLLARQALPDPLDGTAIAAIALLYVGLFPNSISYGLTALFYAFEKAELPAAISTVSAILKAAFGLGALLLGWGVVGLAGVSIILNLITLAILAAQAHPLMQREARAAPPTKIEPALMRDMLATGWPLMINNLLAGLFFKIDVTLLEPIQGRAVVGTYSTAYKWVDALGVIPSLFTMALLPIMSRQAKEDRAALVSNYQFAVKLLVGLALPVAVATTALATTLIGLLGGAQYLPDGAVALQLMIWFIPIGWINSLTNYVLVALDQQRPMRWVFAAGVLFNVSANLLFIPVYSFRASAVITILSEVVLLIGFYWLLRRTLTTINWIALLWKLYAAAAAMIGVMVVVRLIMPASPLLALVAGGGAYLALIVLLRPFTPIELARLAPLLPGPVRRLVST